MAERAKRTGTGRFFFLCATLVVLVPVPAAAQGGGGGDLVVTRLADLSFGTMYAGMPTQVLHTDATAAQFEVQGPRDATVLVTFSLPSSIRSGANTLPVMFQPGDASWSGQDRPSGRTTFDPAAGTTVVVPRSRRFYVWLGGTVSPPMSQPAGSYAGTLTVTVVVN